MIGGLNTSQSSRGSMQMVAVRSGSWPGGCGEIKYVNCLRNMCFTAWVHFILFHNSIVVTRVKLGSKTRKNIEKGEASQYTYSASKILHYMIM